jgi:acyl carrier protein
MVIEEPAVKEIIRRIVADHARLSVPMDSLGDASDLFEAGMTSHASVSLMLALEEAFDVEFPEAMVRKATFQSVSSIESALLELRGVPA